MLYVLDKAVLRVLYGEKKRLGHGRETNTAQSKAECCIHLETMPKCYCFYSTGFRLKHTDSII